MLKVLEFYKPNVLKSLVIVLTPCVCNLLSYCYFSQDEDEEIENTPPSLQKSVIQEKYQADLNDVCNVLPILLK